MRAVIVSGGKIEDYEKIKSYILPDDYVIAADSGYDHLKIMRIKPDIVIGDLDSVKDKKIGENLIKLQVMKDETDTEAAVNIAIEKGFDEILILAGLGTRFDHSVANVFLLKYLASKNVKAMVLNEYNEIYYFFGEIELSGKKGDILSIIPISDISGIETSGLLYSLSLDTLKAGYSRGVSNVFTGNSCKITAKSGEGFIIKSRD